MHIKKISIFLFFISIIIILASVRGALVFHLGFSPNIIYPLTSFMLLILGGLSIAYLQDSIFNGELVFLRNAVTLNLLFGFYFLLSYVLLVKQLNIGIVYAFFIYPIIFFLIRLEKHWLYGIVYSISAITVIGVVLFINLGVNGGFEAIEAAQLALRPGELAYSRIGDNLLPAGYQGHHHDAANILVMCSVLLLSKFALCENGLIRYLYLGSFFSVFMTTVATGSGANIVILIAITGFIFMLLALNNIYLFFILIFFLLFISIRFMDTLSQYLHFIDHISQDQLSMEGGGIFNSLNLEALISSIPSIFFGFGDILDTPMRYSEISFIKILISYGITPFIVQMFILFSPLYYFLRIKNNIIKNNPDLKFTLIIMVMPSFAGIMTLLHYGSLFRVTSIGLFCVLLAIYFKDYLSLKRDLYASHNSN